ncbi:hypothetical protein GMMP15_2020020 [Candidatus Magnetomoraceae bacterium gMMP-15]
MSERTQECYAQSVRQLIEFYNKDPCKISEEELEEYFLYRRNTSSLTFSAKSGICLKS